MTYTHTALYQQIQIAEDQIVRYRRIEESAFMHNAKSGLLTEHTPTHLRRRELRHQLASAIRRYHENILVKKWFLASEEHQLIMEAAVKRPFFDKYKKMTAECKKKELETIKTNIKYHGHHMVVYHQEMNRLGGTNHEHDRHDDEAILTRQGTR